MKKAFLPILIILFGVFYFFDYEITAFFAGSVPWFSNLFAWVGLFPLFLGFIIYGIVKFTNSDEDSRYYLVSHLGVLATLFMYIYFFFQMSLLNVSFAIFISFLITNFFMYLGSKVDEDKLLKIEKEALFYIFVSMISLIAVFVFKELFGRIRYNDLSGESEFMTFLEFNPISGNRSFPSGHTIAACNIIMVYIMALKYNISEKTKKVILYSSIAFIFLTGFSRITLGVHYPSDILASILIYIATFYYYKRLIIKKNKKAILSN